MHVSSLPAVLSIPAKPQVTLTSMVDPELLKMLVCPEDRSTLSFADDGLVKKLNDAIALGRLTNKVGRKLEKQLEGGLIRAAGDVVYPIVDGIPMMLVDEGIPLAQPALNE
jgi:uncharacterized protein YbaR (Trm112 family)